MKKNKMSSIQGFNFDKEKLDILLGYFERGQMSGEQAQELKFLLEEMHRRVLDDGDINTARDIASILMTLKGFLSGRISLTVNKVSL
jgi:hypothetical protein